MPGCSHPHVRLSGDHLECVDCNTKDLPTTITIDLADLMRFSTTVQGIVESLELADMKDVAAIIRQYASKVTIAPQFVWRD